MGTSEGKGCLQAVEEPVSWADPEVYRGKLSQAIFKNVKVIFDDLLKEIFDDLSKQIVYEFFLHIFTNCYISL